MGMNLLSVVCRPQVHKSCFEAQLCPNGGGGGRGGLKYAYIARKSFFPVFLKGTLTSPQYFYS